jgi:hypothetical protein
MRLVGNVTEEKLCIFNAISGMVIVVSTVR